MNKIVKSTVYSKHILESNDSGAAKRACINRFNIPGVAKAINGSSVLYGIGVEKCFQQVISWGLIDQSVMIDEWLKTASEGERFTVIIKNYPDNVDMANFNVYSIASLNSPAKFSNSAWRTIGIALKKTGKGEFNVFHAQPNELKRDFS